MTNSRMGIASTVRILAPAKVNLALRVLAREESGFHQLETVFLALEFGDVVTVSLRGSGVSLEVDGPEFGPIEENLVYRAACAFLDRARRTVGLEILLQKQIPVQGGLGGGSSDAAATLKALEALFPGLVPAVEIWEIAGDLGSDVPFFLSPTPMALAWGRGDRILPLPPLPEASVVLAVPPVGVRTPEAYRLLAEERANRPVRRPPACVDPARMREWQGVVAEAENDFEEVVFRANPLLREIRRALAATSARFSLLSGSGAALFAVFDREEEAMAARNRMQGAFPGTRFILTRTLRRQPDPILDPGVEG